jgi:glycosyltransferase involved in cell wall biosynthesis
MKICLLAPEFPPVWGGVGTYSFELTKHLPKSVEIHVLTPRRESFGRQKVSPTGINPIESLGSNVHIHYISAAHDSFMYNAEFQYACLRQVPKIVKEEKIDVIHSHQAHMPDLLLMFRKLPAKTVVTVHTTIKFQRAATLASHQNISELENSERGTFFLYPFLRVAEELYVKRNNTCITPSSYMAKWLKNNFSNTENVTVIPNCVTLPDNSHSVETDSLVENKISKNLLNKRIILYSGRLLAMKGIDVLVDAIPKISKMSGNSELLFVFAGPGNYNKYKTKLDNMNVKSNYIFTGPVSRETIMSFITKSEIVVVPSYNENCPYAVLEPMSYGKPVVASSVGGIPEIITDGVDGLLVAPGNPDMLANAIIRLLSDNSLKNILGQRAKVKIATKFSWQTNVSKYLKCYSEASTKYLN